MMPVPSFYAYQAYPGNSTLHHTYQTSCTRQLVWPILYQTSRSRLQATINGLLPRKQSSRVEWPSDIVIVTSCDDNSGNGDMMAAMVITMVATEIMMAKMK